MKYLAPSVLSADFAKLGETDARFAQLHRIVCDHNGLWCAEAENYLLANF